MQFNTMVRTYLTKMGKFNKDLKDVRSILGIKFLNDKVESQYFLPLQTTEMLVFNFLSKYLFNSFNWD